MTLHSPNPARPLSPSQRAAVVVITLLLPAVALAAPWGYLVSADGKTRLPLDTPLVVVGTSPKAGAVISGSTVSKKHASISHKKGVVVVKDLRSTTGTLVAGTALRRGRTMQLFQRTKLTFGAETWTFEWGDRGQDHRAAATVCAAQSEGGSEGEIDAEAEDEGRQSARSPSWRAEATTDNHAKVQVDAAHRGAAGAHAEEESHGDPDR